MMYRNMLDYFEETVVRFADKTAVIHGEKKISFSELRSKSRHLSSYISKKMCGMGQQPICVFLPKNIEVVICDIAIIYSCNFFTNLDVKTPAPRIKKIVDTLQPVMVITNTKYADILSTICHVNCKVINLDEYNWKEQQDHNEAVFKQLVQKIDTDPFCIINTSGSTGTPKSVLLTHRGFIDYTNWAVDTFRFDGSEILGVMSAVIFDHYVYEICLMIRNGATLVLLDVTLAAFPAKLMKEIKEKKVNYIFWVPTVMANIANLGLLDKIDLPDLKMVWFAGDVFPTKQFNAWKKQYPDVTFVNLYGPCEITVDCTYYIVNKEIKDDEALPIGIPRRNMDVFLLNEKNQLCTIGEVGEICVRGSALAMGYYNNPEKTAQVFVQNPLNHTYPELIYRTGDLAYWSDAGVLMFKGRKDSLIKHMGNRIELGEIEHVVINVLQIVPNCCVVYDKEKKLITMLYEADGTITSLEIRKALAEQLPRYMIPNRYIEMNELPRNPNGKIDRLKLSEIVNELKG